MNFAKFLGAPILTEHLWWLLLYVVWNLKRGLITQNLHYGKKYKKKLLKQSQKEVIYQYILAFAGMWSIFWKVVGSGGYILTGGVAVADILWQVVGGGEYILAGGGGWWVVVGGGIVYPNPLRFYFFCKGMHSWYFLKNIKILSTQYIKWKGQWKSAESSTTVESTKMF